MRKIVVKIAMGGLKKLLDKCQIKSHIMPRNLYRQARKMTSDKIYDLFYSCLWGNGFTIVPVNINLVDLQRPGSNSFWRGENQYFFFIRDFTVVPNHQAH